MKDPMCSRWIKMGVAALAYCLSVGRLQAAVVFEAGFSGPGNGKGGAYDMVSVGGAGKLNSDTTGQIIPHVSGDFPLGDSGGYFEYAVNPTNTTTTFSVSTFTPNAATNSLDAMTSVVNGDRVINGGIDFFFRADRAMTGGEMRALDSSNTGNGGLRFVFTTQAPGLRLEVISNTGGLFTGSENGNATSSQTVTGPFTFAADTVYHFGLSFATDGEGNVTAKLWCQEGTGAIDLTNATPVATLTFGINESVVTSGFATGDFNLGQVRTVNVTTPITEAYDQLRIYDATPTAFGALENTAVSWRDSSPVTVLQADFRGEGGATGGTHDLVTSGGTGTLVDYGTVSDAFITNASPFRTYFGSSSKGFLRVVTTNNAATGLYGRAAITPASEENSLAAMTVVTNGQRLLRGGLDFFFRSARDITVSAEFRVLDTDNRGAGGLRIVLYNSYDTKLRLEVIANTGGLYTGGEGGATATSFAYDFAGHIASNTLYHMGISFDSTDNGTVTAAIWQKEGTGAIDLHRDVPVGSLTFGINEAVVTNGLTAGSFNCGKLSNQGEVPSTQDFDCLRLYRDTPVTFSALPIPPAGTLIQVY